MPHPDYDVALICENGHVVNAYYQTEVHNNEQFCVRCGSGTSTKCLKCGGEIKGGWLDRWVSSRGGDDSVPRYCEHCGRPHIWTQKIIKAGEDLFAKLDGLSTEDREQLNKSIPDLIYETERTPEAALGIKQALAKIETGSRVFVVEWLKTNGISTVNRLLGIE